MTTLPKVTSTDTFKEFTIKVNNTIDQVNATTEALATLDKTVVALDQKVETYHEECVETTSEEMSAYLETLYPTV